MSYVLEKTDFYVSSINLEVAFLATVRMISLVVNNYLRDFHRESIQHDLDGHKRNKLIALNKTHTRLIVLFYFELSNVFAVAADNSVITYTCVEYNAVEDTGRKVL